MTNVRKSEKSEDKPKRVPFGSHRTKLQVEDEIPGYFLRWFNDADGRLQRAQDGGYVFVNKSEVPRLGQGEIHQDNTDLNSRVSKVVSRGDPVIRAYLMKIKQSFWNEDRKAKDAINDQIDDALRAGTPGGNVVENQYVPKGHKQRV
jgi:hypothetical protein